MGADCFYGSRRSAGMVVVRHTGRGWRVLLLRAYRNWDFPKGLVGADEPALAAAHREVREETGLQDLMLDWGEDYCDTPPYSRGKVARFYLARTACEEILLGASPELGRPEHHEYRWLDFASARRLLVPRLQAVLDWAAGHLDGLRDGPGTEMPTDDAHEAAGAETPDREASRGRAPDDPEDDKHQVEGGPR